MQNNNGISSFRISGDLRAFHDLYSLLSTSEYGESILFKNHRSDKSLYTYRSSKLSVEVDESEGIQQKLTEIRFPIHFEFCKKEKSEYKITNKGLYKKNEDECLVSFSGDSNLKDFFNYIKSNSEYQKLTALILIGGYSTRMGKSKAMLEYHGMPQYQYLEKLCQEIGLDYYFSARESQLEKVNLPKEKTITDKYLHTGPLSGILSAFEDLEDTALLVLACDLPLISVKDIRYLMENRDSMRFGTAFHNDITGFPDPLFTILERSSYANYQQYRSLGYFCPRKLLINEPVHCIQPLSQNVLMNVNTPEDRDRALGYLS